MFRIHRLVAAIGLPLFLANCGEDEMPPSGPEAEPAPGPAARVSAKAADHFRFQVRDRAADAVFSSFDPSGCVETFVFVIGAEETVKEGRGKPSSGPLAFVQLSEFNVCTNEVRELFGLTSEVTFEVSKKLTEARLQATIPAFDVVDGEEVPLVVDLAWAGAGDLGSQSNRFRLKLPGAMVTEWLKGTFRPAQVSGSVTVGDENVATDPIDATMFNVRSGRLEMVRTAISEKRPAW
jgi:hypothetical protein